MSTLDTRPRPVRTQTPSSADTRTAVRLVALREVRERGLSRTTIVSTAITMAIIVLAIGILNVLNDEDRPTYTIGVVGEVAAVEPALAATADQLGADVEVEQVFARRLAEAALRDSDAEAVLDLADGTIVVDADTSDEVRGIVDLVVRQDQLVTALDEAGVGPEQATALLADQTGAVVESVEERDDDERGAATSVAFVGVLLLFVALQGSAGMILTATIEEKSSRVVEVLLGTLQPKHLLAGKLVGMGIVALTQFTLLAAAGLLTATLTSDFTLPSGGLLAIAASVVWVVLGFGFYASLFAVAGTLAGSIEDAQSTAAPMSLLLMGAYFGAIFLAVPNPEELPATLLSLLPPFAPMMLPVRMAQVSVPWWQVGLSAALMVVTTVVVVRLAGRLYRAALLRGGGTKLAWRDVWNTPA